MAASKIDRAISDSKNREKVSTRASAPFEAAEETTTLSRDSAAMDRLWLMRTVRLGFALMLGFEALYFLVGVWRPFADVNAEIVSLHSLMVAGSLLALGISALKWFERRWRETVLASVTLMFLLTAYISLITGEREPLFITVTLALAGAGALMPWGRRWQAALTIAGVAAIVARELVLGLSDASTAFHWFGVIMAAALGYLLILASERHQTELAEWMGNVETSNERLRLIETKLRAEIAERTLAQQQLEFSETKLRRIFETSVDLITVSRYPEHYLVDCNPEFLALTGLTREEALSLRIGEMGIWHRPEQYQEFLRRLREYGSIPSMEMELGRRDGTTKQFLTSASLTVINGAPHVVTTGRDISELKQTEDELRATERALSAQVAALHRTEEQLRAEMAEREFAQRRLADSERKFRRVFETSLDAIALIDAASWQVIDCNTELIRILGREREQIIGHTTAELNFWASRQALREVTERLLDTGMVRNLEIEFRHSSGAVAPYLFSAVVAEIDGRPCVMAVTRDISRLKRTERELIAAREAALAASRAKSEFLSSMSHEIRTPMNAILGMADLLWETRLDAEQRRYLHTMRANGDALLSLVNDILDLAKVESGRLNLERSECDLVALAEGAIETVATRAHEKGLELALDVGPEVPVTILVDSLRVRQILINLLGNAIKFTGRGEVTLTVEATVSAQEETKAAFVDSRPANGAAAAAGIPPAAERRLLRFSVRDTGIGIPAEKIETIFASFTQADSTTTRKYGGSGLGLAIVKRLVDLMGGQLAVESDPGRGSTFSFVAPFEISPGTVSVKERARKVRRLSGARLLVVDDSPTSRRILSGILAMGGATVTEAGDGAAAIAEIRSARAAGRPYDVVLADCGMPKPDGVAIGRHLRTAASARETLVLMLTGDDLPSRLGLLRDMGFGESARCLHLIKPARRADLYGVITAVRSGKAWNGAPRARGNGTSPSAANANGSIEPSLMARPAVNGAARLNSRRRAILLAEDSPDNRLVIEAYLKNTPCVVDHAENGEIVVRKFIEGNYDAILMDIQMPVMDGYAATAEIRRWERENNRPPTPIIALTASADNEAMRKSLQTGCNAHVAKPVKRATLLKAIDEAVEPHGSTKLSDEGNMSVPNQPSNAPKPPAKCAAQKCGAGQGEAQDRIIVHIDEELSDLMPGFLERKRQDAAAILAASERREGEEISRLGHKLKGEGGGYGLDEVSTVGRKLEQAAAEHDFAATAGLARELVSFLDRLEIVYQPMEG